MRGVAVLGIVYANIVAFGHPLAAGFWPGAMISAAHPGDDAVWLSHFLLIDGRMRGLFCLLFGAGLVLFTQDKPAQNRPVALQCSRLFWLALFGAAHYFLLFRGDILFSYAVCGAIALFAVRMDATRLLVLGVLLYLAGAFALGALYWPEVVAEADFLKDCEHWRRCLEMRPDHPTGEQYRSFLGNVALEAKVMQGGWASIVRYNIAFHASGLVDAALTSLTETLPLMLIGMGLFKGGLLGTGHPGKPMLGASILAIMVSMTALGLLASWIMKAEYPLYLILFAGFAPAALARLPMIVGLAVILSWLAPMAARQVIGRRLVLAGRTAFTNYIGTSVLMVVLFQGWGLGWHGQLSRLQLLGVVLAVWAIMLAWPGWWLARYRQGPLEKLWRQLWARVGQLDKGPCP